MRAETALNETQITMPRPLTYEEIYRNLDGLTALAVAQTTTMGKTKGEKDTEFVKRIVATYAAIAQADPAMNET